MLGVFVGAEASFLQTVWNVLHPGPPVGCDQMSLGECGRRGCRVYEANRAVVNRAVAAAPEQACENISRRIREETYSAYTSHQDPNWVSGIGLCDVGNLPLLFKPENRLAAMNALFNIVLDVNTESPPVVTLYDFKPRKSTLLDAGPRTLNEAVAALGDMFVLATEQGSVAWHAARRETSRDRLEVLRSKARHIKHLVEHAATGSDTDKALVLGYAVFLVSQADRMDTSHDCP